MNHLLAASLFLLASCAAPVVDAPEIVLAPAEPTPIVSASATASAAPASPPKPTTLSRGKLRAISVKQRLPGLAKRAEREPGSWQRLELELIGEAITKADRDMFVRYVSQPADPQAAPEEEFSDSAHFGLYPDPGVPAGELERYGVGTLLAYAEDYTYLLVVSVKPQATPAELPGLIWEVTDDRVLFASLDGSDFSVPAENVALGAGSPSTWPAVHDPVLGRHPGITNIRDRFASNQEDGRFLKCAERAFGRARKTMKEDDPSAHAPVVRKACAKEIVAWQKAFAAAIDAEVTTRSALLENAKARLMSLGIGQ